MDHKLKLLKRQSHEIFASGFFHKSIVPRPLSNVLKYFQILFRIRGDIREYVLCYIARSHNFFSPRITDELRAMQSNLI
jgi:hypothetical protein